MILRKPYAILIKNFKLIHMIITGCMIYLVYRTFLIYNFISEYMKTAMLAAGKDITGELFNKQMFLLPGLIIILLIILLVVMFRKKKPKLFYIFNIIFYLTKIGLYSFLYNKLNYIETNIIEIREIKLYNDLTLLLLIIQVVSMILCFIRAVGLDIKKFDFGKDLMELEVGEEDNEEFEVNVDVETNIIKRSLNRNRRFAKYVYLENRFIINTILVIVLFITTLLVYLNLNVYNVIYKEGDTFLIEFLNVGVSKSYLTQKDYVGDVIASNGKQLLVVKLNVKAQEKGHVFNTAKAEVVVNNKTYFPTKIEQRSSLFDLGAVYYNEEISTKLEKILLVYEIPAADMEKDMQFKYINDVEIKKNQLNPKYISVGLKPIRLDVEVKPLEEKISKTVVLNNDLFGTTSIVIKSFDISKEYALKYNYCLSVSECYPSIEYLTPVLNTNFDKVLLRVNATISIDENEIIDNVYNPYNIINNFGKIVYEKDGNTYSSKGRISKVDSYRTNTGDNYYLEVDSNIMSADKVYLLITIRNKQYKFPIK